MNEYKYISAGADGKIKKGRARAMSAGHLRAQLEHDGSYLIKYSEVGRAGRTLNSLQLADICRELSSLLGAGVPIGRALDIVARRADSVRLHTLMSSVNGSVKRGDPLYTALERENGYFPPLLIGMVKSGETGGKLEDSLARMAAYYEAEYRTEKELRNAMLYPAILLVITLVVIVVVFTFVFPSFMRLFEGMELPAITEFMIAISRLFTEQPYVLLAAALLVTVLAIWLKDLSSIRSALDRLKLKLPYIGRLNRIIYTARFARTFSALYAGGVPVLSALSQARETLGNGYISAQFDEVLRCVSSGVSLSRALSVVDGLDVKLTSALAVGEESGRTEELLMNMAGIMEYDAAVASKKLVKLAEPLLIVLMAAVILVVVLSVMIPIYNMYGNLGAEWGI